MNDERPQADGQTLCAKVACEWNVLEFLGGGVAGRSFKIYNQMLDRLQTLKIILDEEKNKEEAKILGKLQDYPHQTIPVILGASRKWATWEGEPILAIVRDYVDGRSLADYMLALNEHPLQEREENAIKLGGHVYQFIKHIDSLGIHHNDLHPQNILITKDGKVKIIDFGYATINNDEMPTNNRLFGQDIKALGGLLYKIIAKKNLCNMTEEESVRIKSAIRDTRLTTGTDPQLLQELEQKIDEHVEDPLLRYVIKTTYQKEEREALKDLLLPLEQPASWRLMQKRERARDKRLKEEESSRKEREKILKEREAREAAEKAARTLKKRKRRLLLGFGLPVLGLLGIMGCAALNRYQTAKLTEAAKRERQIERQIELLDSSVISPGITLATLKQRMGQEFDKGKKALFSNNFDGATQHFKASLNAERNYIRNYKRVAENLKLWNTDNYQIKYVINDDEYQKMEARSFLGIVQLAEGNSKTAETTLERLKSLGSVERFRELKADRLKSVILEIIQENKYEALDALVETGIGHMDRGEWMAARDSFTSAERIKESFVAEEEKIRKQEILKGKEEFDYEYLGPDINLLRGILSVEQGDYASAKTLFRKTMERAKGGEDEELRRLAEHELKKGNVSKARIYYQPIIEQIIAEKINIKQCVSCPSSVEEFRKPRWRMHAKWKSVVHPEAVIRLAEIYRELGYNRQLRELTAKYKKEIAEYKKSKKEEINKKKRSKLLNYYTQTLSKEYK